LCFAPGPKKLRYGLPRTFWRHGTLCVLGVSENPDKIPGHRRRIYANVQVRSSDDTRGDKESPKDC
jgi:hypothetical protein